MRTEHARASWPFGKLGGVVRITPVFALLVGLSGCVREEGNVLEAACMEQNPGKAAECCELPGWHFDQGVCCPDGAHAVTDVEHADWKACVPDEDAGAGACPSASTGMEMDAGPDAP